MANYKEIVTKAVLGKGKKRFSNTYSVTPSVDATTVLGCWVINHTFKGVRDGDKIVINGTFDVNIWYSCCNDTSTEVIKESRTYREVVSVRTRDEADVDSEEIIVRSLSGPSCTSTTIEDGNIVYTIEKELGIELVGDTKVKIQVDDDEEPWDNLDDEEVPVDASLDSDILKRIDEEVTEDYLQ